MLIRAYGVPAPQGSKKVAFRGNATRSAIITDANEKTTPWRSDVINAARKVKEEQNLGCLSGYVVARMVFSFRRPKTVPYRKRAWPNTSPDVSKLARSTEDALQAAGVLEDDGMIVEYTRLAKVYCNEDDEALETPGCWIVLGLLEPQLEIGKK